jgi:hypothetical protein
MKAGDHLRVLKDGVWDHAIDVGDRTVIRWVPRLGVLRSGQGEFVSGAERGEVVVHRERTFKPREVVARAFSRFAESAYAAMFSSAEQFATWCKNGQLPAVAGAPAAPRKAAARKAAPAKAFARAAPRKAAPEKPAPKGKAPARGAAARPAKDAPRKSAPKKAAARKAPARKAPRRSAKTARRAVPSKAAKKAVRRPARKPARRR